MFASVSPASPEFVADGVAIFAQVLAPNEITTLVRLLPENIAGLRNLLQKIPVVRALADSPQLRDLLAKLGCPNARPVRALFFDKNPAHNWKGPWHQDLTIAVHERHETPGYGPWSVKEGVSHVQPPAALLAGMVTLRLHLDDCDADNGALCVQLGSHLHGRLSAEAIACRDSARKLTCCLRAGGVVAMRPLLLHASSPARVPRHRRIIHLDYSPNLLPPPLAWFDGTSSGLEIAR